MKTLDRKEEGGEFSFIKRHSHRFRRSDARFGRVQRVHRGPSLAGKGRETTSPDERDTAVCLKETIRRRMGKGEKSSKGAAAKEGKRETPV